jgi:autotransporter-associated beta strand protein
MGTDYNMAANWTGGLPGTGDAAVFSSAVTFQPILSAPITNQQIRFTTLTGGWTLSGSSALTLTSTGTGATAGTGSAIVSANTSGTTTISAPIILGGAAATTATFTQTAGGTLAISGNISSTNAITGLSLAATGATGTFILSGSNSYNGTTTLGSNTALNINSATAISAGTLVFSGSSTLDNTSGSAITLSNNNNINLSGGTLTFTGTKDLSFGSGTVTASVANRTITTTAGTLTIGNIDADTTARTFTKAGAGGTLVIQNAAGSNFQGGFTLTSGGLQIGNNTALGGGGITFTAGTLQAINSDITLANTSTLTALTISGTQSLTLNGKLTGATGGNRTLTNNITPGAGGKLLTLGNVDISHDTGVTARTLTIAGTGNTTIGGTIANGVGTTTANGLTITNTGTTTLNGNNTYTGQTNLSQAANATVIVGHKNALGSGQLRFVSSAGTTLFQANTDLSGANAIANNVLLNSSVTTISGSNNITFNGNWTLNGTSRTLNSSLDAGKTLVIAGSVALTDGLTTGAFTLAGTGATTISGNITNGSGTSGSVTITNTGVTTLSGTNTYSGLTTVSAGRLILAGDNTGAAGAITIANGATVQASSLTNLSAGALQFNAGSTAGNKATLALRFDGNTSIAKNASGVGAAVIDQIAEFNVDRATAGGPTGGTIIWGNGGTMAFNADRGQLLVTGSNGYGLTLNQALTWTSASNQTNKPNIVNNAPGLLTIQGNITTGNTNNFSFEFTGTGDTLVTGTVGGGSALWRVNKTGNGTLTLANAVTPTASSVRNLVQAGTLKLAVTSALDNGNTANWTAARIAVASGATLAFNVGGTNEFTTGNVTTLLTNLAASTVTVTTSTGNGMNAGSVLGFDTTNASGGSFTIADTIADTTGTAGGARSLTKLGTNTLTLTGANTYSGATTVTGGALQVGSTGRTGTGAVTVQTGSTILGTGVVRGSTFTAQSSSTVQAGDGTAQSNYGTLTFTPVSGSGSFDFQSGSSTILGLNPGGTGDLLSFDGLSNGTLLFNGNLSVTAPGYNPVSVDTFNLLDWANLTTTFASRFSAGSYSGYLLGNGDDNLGFDLPDISTSGYGWDISQFTTLGIISTVLVVPEPSRALLLMLSLVGLALRRRR